MAYPDTKSKILIVDDETEICSLLREYFQDVYCVEVANDGQEALSKAREYRPDCILLDVKMPKLNGLDALKAIKTDFPDAEIIMVTAAGSVRVATESVSRGAFGYVFKPVDLDDLENKIQLALERKKQKSG